MSGVEFLTPLLTGLAAAGAGAGLSAALRPKPPKPQTPARMPDPESPEVQEARRRRIAETQARSGRESTILSDDAPFSNNFLGE